MATHMKLDKRVAVQRRVDLLAAEGVEFVTNTKLAKISRRRSWLMTSTRLCSRRATKLNDLPIEGRDSGHPLCDGFLRANTKSLLDSEHTDGDHISRRKTSSLLAVIRARTGVAFTATRLRDAVAVRDYAAPAGRAR